MIHAHLNDPNLPLVLPGPVWSEALEWIRREADEADLGIHELRGERMFVNVQAYDTEPREKCRFESHRRYVDLQYTIRGEEGIDYRNAGELDEDGGYEPGRDLQFYRGADPACTVTVAGEGFCVFFPEDAHRPKVAVGGEPAPLKKLVVKIDLELLRS